MNRAIGNRRHNAAGFSLMELLVSMGVTIVIMGATMTAMSNAIRANQSTLLVTGMNSNLRTGMDLAIRDLLQTGQGMPNGGVILIPSGLGSAQINLPGPPGTAYKSVVGDVDISAVTPGPNLGPIINGVATDTITVLEADSAFDHRNLTAITSTSITVSKPQSDNTTCDISNGGPDDVLPGQLIMLQKGSAAALVEVTSVDGDQKVFFAAGDSLNLNQAAAAAGNITALIATAPPDVFPGGNPLPLQVIPTTATRIRMISYYLDATTVPARPRLVRRMNNGNALTFNNTLGNVVAFDVEGLLITYDINDGATNPAGARFNAADLAGTGSCAPNPCNMNQIRKVNVVITGRSPIVSQTTGQFFRNSLATSVSLRSLAFVDRYRG